MKEIIVKFLTSVGEDAYQKVREEGEQQSRFDKAVARRVCREKIINDDPMTLAIEIKIPRLANACGLDNQVIAGLRKFGAEKDKDYTMKIKY